MLDVVTHDCNPSTLQTEVGGSRVQGHSGTHSEVLSKESRKKGRREGRNEGGIKGCMSSFAIEYIICVLLLEKELSVEFGVYRDNGGVILKVAQ